MLDHVGIEVSDYERSKAFTGAHIASPPRTALAIATGCD